MALKNNHTKEVQIDTQVRRQVWEGALPLVLQLRRSEVIALSPPQPVYVLASRCTYLSTVLLEARAHFEPAVSAEARSQEMWAEYNGKPVKWNLPLGVVFDQIQARAAHPSESHYSKTPLLPCKLTVRFSAFPATHLLQCPNIETVKSHYMHTLKQANYLKHGGGSGINALSPAQQNQLWESVCEFESFWEVANQLWPTDLKKIPIRVVREDPSLPLIQWPMSPYDSEGKPHTLAHVLHKTDATLFPNPLAEKNEGNVRVHGIFIPLHTPLLWLSHNLCHPDNFVYVVLSP